MADLIKFASKDQIPEGFMKAFTVNGKTIMVCNVSDTFFALDDICTHDHCSLSSEGFLDNSTIICGCHGAQFDAQNGNVLSPPATTNLKTYKIVTKDNDLFIEI